jgi:molybdopterin-guanine dinucleotide biosynthesis protein A
MAAKTGVRILIALNPKDLAGCVLAGGLSRRMGQNKAFVRLGGETLVAHAAKRLAPQVPQLAVNANGDAQAYADLNCTIIADTIADHPGPLAGVLAAMTWARQQGKEWVVTVPIDTPFFPRDLAARLAEAAAGHDLAVASSGGHRHPVFTLWPVGLAEDVRHALVDEDKRRVTAILDRYRCGSVDWAVTPFDPFFNINTPEDLVQAERLLAEFRP